MSGKRLKTLSQYYRWVKSALLQYYNVPTTVAFRQFRNGAIYFGVGIGMILMANQMLPPSVRQEWIVAFGLVMATVGFLMAMTAEMRLIISRLVQFARPDSRSPPKTRQ